MMNFIFLKILFIFKEKGREGEREGEEHQCVVTSHASPTGDLARKPGMCPDWELNQQPFGSQAGTQSNEPHQPGQMWLIILITSCKTLSSHDIFWLASIPLWMTQCIDSHSEATSLSSVVKPESCHFSYIWAVWRLAPACMVQRLTRDLERVYTENLRFTLSGSLHSRILLCPLVKTWFYPPIRSLIGAWPLAKSFKNGVSLSSNSIF